MVAFKILRSQSFRAYATRISSINRYAACLNLDFNDVHSSLPWCLHYRHPALLKLSWRSSIFSIYCFVLQHNFPWRSWPSTILRTPSLSALSEFGEGSKISEEEVQQAECYIEACSLVTIEMSSQAKQAMPKEKNRKRSVVAEENAAKLDGKRSATRGSKDPLGRVLCSPSSGKRSSIFRGVTKHKWTGRYEVHLWDKSIWNESQNKRGKQVYLGAFDEEEDAARTYDFTALKYWGGETLTNFPVSDYSQDLEGMQNVSREEYLSCLGRRSSGFSRGASKYCGVARHHQNGRWEARIGRVFGNKYLYLGTYNTQEEAATAYDLAAIEYRGLNAVTNFDLNRYIRWLRPNPAVPILFMNS